MKLLRILLFVLTPAFAWGTEEILMAGAFEFNEGVATVIVNGKYGYINTRGVPITPAIYTLGSGMRDGVATVLYENEYRYIDHNGTLLNDKPASVARTQGALERFEETDAQGYPRQGYKDKDGNIVIEARYEYLDSFSEGLAMFAIQDNTAPQASERLFGYLDLAGNVTIPASFQGAWGFSEGVANVVGDGRHYFINHNGERAFPRDFYFAYSFSEGLAAVNLALGKNPYGGTPPGSWSFIDHKGDVVIAAFYEQAGSFSEGLAPVMLGGKWGFINKQGELVIPARFNYAGPFSEGFALVSIDGKRGYIDRLGNYLWEPSE
ncbi:MAG: WG repeat-containing protein [Pseudomonadales bacterium]|jgi:hypothetical protein|nr:WG repeat-containing protein [Pseudomonadales bacterium]